MALAYVPWRFGARSKLVLQQQASRRLKLPEVQNAFGVVSMQEQRRR